MQTLRRVREFDHGQQTMQQNTLSAGALSKHQTQRVTIPTIITTKLGLQLCRVVDFTELLRFEQLYIS